MLVQQISPDTLEPKYMFDNTETTLIDLQLDLNHLDKSVKSLEEAHQLALSILRKRRLELLGAIQSLCPHTFRDSTYGYATCDICEKVKKS